MKKPHKALPVPAIPLGMGRKEVAMFLVDYHTHSCCSSDSTARLEDMAFAARQTGLAELCTTDHCDLQQEDGSVLSDWCRFSAAPRH